MNNEMDFMISECVEQSDCEIDIDNGVLARKMRMSNAKWCVNV